MAAADRHRQACVILVPLDETEFLLGGAPLFTVQAGGVVVCHPCDEVIEIFTRGKYC